MSSWLSAADATGCANPRESGHTRANISESRSPPELTCERPAGGSGSAVHSAVRPNGQRCVGGGRGKRRRNAKGFVGRAREVLLRWRVILEMPHSIDAKRESRSRVGVSPVARVRKMDREPRHGDALSNAKEISAQ